MAWGVFTKSLVGGGEGSLGVRRHPWFNGNAGRLAGVPRVMTLVAHRRAACVPRRQSGAAVNSFRSCPLPTYGTTAQ